MADVFISYKRENQGAVQRIVEGLRSAGIAVWWDRDIAPNAPWEATIERELAAAKVVIVCWSPAAVASENVKAEARRARNQGRLIQVFVEPCEPPLFFGERQGVDLAGWRGDASDRRFETLLKAVRAVMEGRRPPEGVGYAPKKRAPWGALATGFVLVGVGLAFILNLGGARDTICSLAPLEARCRNAGLLRAETLDARATLLARVPGLWGNQASAEGPACAETVRYSVERRDGEEVIVARSADYESVGRVVSAEGASIFTRSISPAAEAGAQWQIEPQADLLTLTDRNGVKTPLVRCGT